MKALFGFSVIVGLSVGLLAQTAAAQIINPNRIHQLKNLKVTKLVAAGHTIDAWRMDDEAKNEEGMMFLTDKEVKTNQGALFLFPQIQPADQYHGFWMHHTLIPLDIIYIGANKKVVNIAEGKVENDSVLMAKAPYFYVLELKQGTAKKYGIKPGTVFQIPSSVKANW